MQAPPRYFVHTTMSAWLSFYGIENPNDDNNGASGEHNNNDNGRVERDNMQAPPRYFLHNNVSYVRSRETPTTDSWVWPLLSRAPFSQNSPTNSTSADVQGGKFTTTRPTCYASKHTIIYDEGE